MSRNGFSLTELLVVLALSAIVCTLSINMLISSTSSNQWGKLAADYIEHLAALYQQQLHKTGVEPIATATPNGLPALLPTADTGITYNSSSPESIDYPGGFRVYIKPEQLVGTVTGLTNPIHTGTNNREWVLLDMDPSSTPSNLSTNPDLLLLRIDNNSGRILTARQVASGTFSASFYDTLKGY